MTAEGTAALGRAVTRKIDASYSPTKQLPLSQWRGPPMVYVGNNSKSAEAN